MKYIYFDSIDSTNNEAKRMISRAQVSENLCLVAFEQTAGRGRQGKSFFSPDTGLYMTVVLPVGRPIASQVTMTVRTAAAVCSAIEEVTGISAGIKWVNDIYVRGKKCCGILCEAVNDYEKGVMQYMIAGIGINIYTKEWPEEIKNIAGSLYEEDPDGACPMKSNLSSQNEKPLPETPDTGTVAGRLTEKIAENLKSWIFDVPAEEFLTYYKSRSIVLGKEIVFTEDGESRTGIAADIDEKGGLVVETAPQNIVLRSGEISIKLR